MKMITRTNAYPQSRYERLPFYEDDNGSKLQSLTNGLHECQCFFIGYTYSRSTNAWGRSRVFTYKIGFSI